MKRDTLLLTLSLVWLAILIIGIPWFVLNM